jgi:hypothetical protein
MVSGRVRRVPRQVTLAVMASLAVLVDRKSLPASLTGGLLQWLSIAWIFKLPAE